MSNAGKFHDTTPQLRAAGTSKYNSDSIKTCLQRYTLNDTVNALKHDEKDDEDSPFPYKPQTMYSNRNNGIFTEMRDILSRPVLTNFQQLIDDLKCTPYESYWNAEIGRTRDPTPALRKGMDPMRTTFGQPVARVDIGDIINPRKSVYRVLYDSQVGHELYRRSHNDYNPGEQKCRNYYCPPFKASYPFGEKSTYDPRGIWVRCCCSWCVSEPVVVANKIQAQFQARNNPQIGKIRTPNNNIDSVPTGHRFGKKTPRPFYDVKDLLANPSHTPCIFKRDFYDWMTHLNKVRCYLKKNRGKISLDDLYHKIRYYDKEQSGWVPMDFFYRLTQCAKISFIRDLFEPLLEFVGILRDGHVNYKICIGILDVDQLTIDMVRIEENHDDIGNFITTNQEATRDRCTMDNTNSPVAGLPTLRNDLARPNTIPGSCKADMESLGDDTSVGTLLNPSIYTNYGVSHIQFFQPRNPEVLRSLFEKLGFEFTDDSFQTLWDLGTGIDKTGLVCVDTFKKLLEKSLPPPTFREENQNYECYHNETKPCPNN